MLSYQYTYNYIHLTLFFIQPSKYELQYLAKLT